MVGVNHRLGVLGFLDVSHLGDEFADSGNVGMLDIVAALEWVRDNIAEFGGDASNVTIFGESGGGSKVTCLLGMPSAQGLFHSACAMSGALLEAHTPETARANTDAVLEQLGVGNDVEALRKLDANAIVQASVAISGSGLAAARAGFGPTLSPGLPQHPVDAARAGSGCDVNVVLGCTTHEMVAFMGTPELFASDEPTVREMLRGMLGDNADLVFEGYRAANPDDSPASIFVLIVSDQFMRIRHIRYAEALLDGGAPNPRMYLFDFRRSSPDGVERAGHGSDMPFFFDNLDKAPASDGPHAPPLVRAMSGALIALARSGDPNHEGLPSWPAYSTSERPTMIFDVESHVETDPLSAERRVWDDRRAPRGPRVSRGHGRRCDDRDGRGERNGPGHRATSVAPP